MTLFSEDEYSDISDTTDIDKPVPIPRGQQCIAFSAEEQEEVPRDPRLVAFVPRLRLLSTLALEMAKCRQVFKGKFVLPFCSANVMGHWVGGGLNPAKYIPSRKINLSYCRTLKRMPIPEVGEIPLQKYCAVIVFTSYYRFHEMMEASWADFRNMLFTMAPSPCALKLQRRAWGQFLHPGDSGVNILGHYNPELFLQLEGVPCLYMVLYKSVKVV